MRCVARLSLLLAAAALICALPITVSAARQIAPPYDSAGGLSADATFGVFGAHATAPAATVAIAESGVVFKKTWRAGFTGTAAVTATYQLSGSVSATATIDPKPGGGKGSARVASSVIGSLSVAGRSKKTTFAKVEAICRVSSDRCVQQESEPLVPSASVTLQIPVQKGKKYGITTGADAQVAGQLVLVPVTASVAGDACVNGGAVVCPQPYAGLQSKVVVEITRLA